MAERKERRGASMSQRNSELAGWRAAHKKGTASVRRFAQRGAEAVRRAGGRGRLMPPKAQRRRRRTPTPRRRRALHIKSRRMSCYEAARSDDYGGDRQMPRHGFMASVLVLGFAASITTASAQTGSLGTLTGQTPNPQQAPSSTATTSEETRPATTTFYGDTGLWFVPTAEVLAQGKWSATLYRRGTNYRQGYTNVGDFAGTFAFGIRGRAEFFTSFLVDTRIDRDTRPLFVADDTEIGSFVDRYPRVNQGWTGDNIGDWFVGGKVNLRSEFRQDRAAVAVRGVLKIPTGDDEVGVSTGQTDFFVDFIGSKELTPRVEWSGYAGYEWRAPGGLTPGRVPWGLRGSCPGFSGD